MIEKLRNNMKHPTIEAKNTKKLETYGTKETNNAKVITILKLGKFKLPYLEYV